MVGPLGNATLIAALAATLAGCDNGGRVQDAAQAGGASLGARGARPAVRRPARTRADGAGGLALLRAMAGRVPRRAALLGRCGTSGLLSRSNKVMYDLRTRSVLDTFTGHALSGPLRDAGVTLEQTSVIASTWGAWKRAHPDTRIVARDGGIGRDYPTDPLHGRDDEGPIFPTGPVDPRLPVQTRVIGVIARDGTPVAFPSNSPAASRAVER